MQETCLGRSHPDSQPALDDDPEITDISYLRQQIDSVNSSNTSYLKVHEDIAEAIGDDTNEDEESAVLDTHEDPIWKTLTLITRLIDTKTIHLDTMALMEAEVCTHPDNLYTSTLQRLEDNRKELARALNRSTIQSTRPVKRLVKSFPSRLLHLNPIESKPKTDLDASLSVPLHHLPVIPT